MKAIILRGSLWYEALDGFVAANKLIKIKKEPLSFSICQQHQFRRSSGLGICFPAFGF